MPQNGPKYVGRFAPSPSGPLHIGSLLAALASYLDAKAHCGTWLLRIEDIDPPREEQGAAQSIIDSLRCHGLIWDGEISWQHQHSHAFEQTLETLLHADELFQCSCSRRQLARNNGLHQRPCIAPLNPGSFALRLKADQREIHFIDRLQGPQHEHMSNAVGDTILKRRDGLYAYQLAVVVDDISSGITDIVRGVDLLESTARQIYLQQKLSAPTPRYLHIPVLTDTSGDKLSKQRAAPALDNNLAVSNIRRCLQHLGQPTPPALLKNCADILHWATAHWRVEDIPAQTHILA